MDESEGRRIQGHVLDALNLLFARIDAVRPPVMPEKEFGELALVVTRIATELDFGVLEPIYREHPVLRDTDPGAFPPSRPPFIEREFEIGAQDKVRVQFFKPEPDEKAWRCTYSIQWPNAEDRSEAYGVDGVQALQLAMTKADAELRTSVVGDKLTFHSERDLGLPSAKVFRP